MSEERLGFNHMHCGDWLVKLNAKIERIEINDAETDALFFTEIKCRLN